MRRHRYTPLPIAALLLLPLTGAMAADDAAPSIIISGTTPGQLFFVGEKPQFKVKLSSQGVDKESWSIAATVNRIADDGVPGAPISVKPVALSSDGSALVVTIPAKEPGYYETMWTAAENGTTRLTEKRSFAIIPKNEQSRLRPDSPFGVNIHLWGPREVPAIVQRAGIAWVRDHMVVNVDPRTGAATDMDMHYQWVTKAHNLCFLPVSEYYEPKDGRDINGVFTIRKAVSDTAAYFTKNKGYITHFEIYNEPYGFRWGPFFDGPELRWDGGKWVKPFTTYARAQTQLIHSIDPSVKVLWPELDVIVHSNSYVKEGATRDEMQIIAPHPYNVHSQYPEDQFFSTDLPKVRTALVSNGMTDEIWFTEFGYSSFTADPIAPNTTGYRPTSEWEQGDRVVRTIILGLAGGARKFFWYDMYEDGDGPHNPEHHFGLTRYETFDPKPALVAYSNMIHELEGARYIGRLRSDQWAYAFEPSKGKTPVVAAWTRTGSATEKWKVGGSAKSVRCADVYGTSWVVPVVDGQIEVTLTETPVFIHGLKRSDLSLRE